MRPGTTGETSFVDRLAVRVATPPFGRRRFLRGTAIGAGVIAAAPVIDAFAPWTTPAAASPILNCAPAEKERQRCTAKALRDGFQAQIDCGDAYPDVGADFGSLVACIAKAELAVALAYRTCVANANSLCVCLEGGFLCGTEAAQPTCCDPAVHDGCYDNTLALCKPKCNGCDEYNPVTNQCENHCTQPGKTCCGTSCVDTNFDNSNCGTCGHVCGANENCTNGVCVAGCGPGSFPCPIINDRTICCFSGDPATGHLGEICCPPGTLAGGTPWPGGCAPSTPAGCPQ